MDSTGHWGNSQGTLTLLGGVAQRYVGVLGRGAAAGIPVPSPTTSGGVSKPTLFPADREGYRDLLERADRRSLGDAWREKSA
jgi:hypothetical protein